MKSFQFYTVTLKYFESKWIDAEDYVVDNLITGLPSPFKDAVLNFCVTEVGKIRVMD